MQFVSIMHLSGRREQTARLSKFYSQYILNLINKKCLKSPIDGSTYIVWCKCANENIVKISLKIPKNCHSFKRKWKLSLNREYCTKPIFYLQLYVSKQFKTHRNRCIPTEPSILIKKLLRQLLLRLNNVITIFILCFVFL